MAVPAPDNFNDTVPAAPSGNQNVKWQADNGNPRNVSAYVPISSGGGASVTFTSETPVGTMNGTNTAFTLSATPTTGSLHLYLNGVAQVPTTDYSISGTTITYVTAPDSVDLMIAQYTH